MTSFKNQINEKIPRSGVIDQQTINPHDLCYQCSKDTPEFLSGKLIIRDCIDEPCFPVKMKSLLYKIQINTLLKNNDGSKRSKYDR